MPFVLGARSRAKLEGVQPRLVRVVERAIVLTTQDFGVHEGVRALERQREYVKRGVSKTLASKHLKQADGFGHAVDLVPYVDGALRWEWPPIYAIAAAVRQAAEEQDVNLRWGGVWDLPMRELPREPEGIKAAVANYARRHPGPDFLDGPHYELRS